MIHGTGENRTIFSLFQLEYQKKHEYVRNLNEINKI